MKIQKFPNLLKLGLKEGDVVYSLLHGKGKVEVILEKEEYPISVTEGGIIIEVNKFFLKTYFLMEVSEVDSVTEVN